MKPSEYVAKGWCQGMSARTANGDACRSDSPYACKWCIAGSIGIAYPEDIQRRMIVSNKLYDVLGHSQISKWNDDPKRTQAEVVQLLQSIGE